MAGESSCHRMRPPEHDRTTRVPSAAASRAARRLVSATSRRAHDVMSRGMWLAPPHSRYSPCASANALRSASAAASVALLPLGGQAGERDAVRAVRDRPFERLHRRQVEREEAVVVEPDPAARRGGRRAHRTVTIAQSISTMTPTSAQVPKKPA